METTKTTQPQTTTSVIENCRYCLMCRHVCPVGHVTHRETLTPHGWGLTIASIERGLLAWDPATLGVLFSCADCGTCRSFCATDQPLPEAIAAARAGVAAAGLAPEAHGRFAGRVGLDLVDSKMAKHIKGPIFELRKDRHRIMFGRDTQRYRFVLLSTFYKNSYHTPLDEIEKAQRYWSDYLKTGSCEVFAVLLDGSLIHIGGGGPSTNRATNARMNLWLTIRLHLRLRAVQVFV